MMNKYKFILDIGDHEIRRILYLKYNWPMCSTQDPVASIRLDACIYHNWPKIAFEDEYWGIRLDAYNHHKWPIDIPYDPVPSVRSAYTDYHERTNNTKRLYRISHTHNNRDMNKDELKRRAYYIENDWPKEAFQDNNMINRIDAYQYHQWPKESFQDTSHIIRERAYQYHDWPKESLNDEHVSLRVKAYRHNKFPICAFDDKNWEVRRYAYIYHAWPEISMNDNNVLLMNSAVSFNDKYSELKKIIHNTESPDVIIMIYNVLYAK